MPQTDNKDNSKNRLWALLLTLLITAGTIGVLLTCGLRYQFPPEGAVELKQDSILFAGEEFVMLGDFPEPMPEDDLAAAPAANDEETADEEPQLEADDLEDAGRPEPKPEPKPKVTQEKESPMKVEKKPEEPKKKKEGTKTEQKPQDKDKNKRTNDTKTTPAKSDKTKEQAAKTNNATNNRVKNAFANGNGSGSGKQGSPNGNSSTGVLSGKPGLGGLVGYTLENWARPNPNSKWAGRVVVQVHVNPRGKVTQARAINSTGDIAAHPEMRKACEQAALKSSFSVPKNTTTEGIGTVTYTWH